MLLVSSFSSHFLRLAPRRLQPPSICRLWLDLHLLQVFVGGVFVAVVLHLVEVPLFGRQHGVDLGGGQSRSEWQQKPAARAERESNLLTMFSSHLHDAVTDGAVLPFPQKHQADHNHGCYGHGDHQQADQGAAAKAEVLPQGAIGLLTSRGNQWGEELKPKTTKTLSSINTHLSRFMTNFCCFEMTSVSLLLFCSWASLIHRAFLLIAHNNCW